jgi:hypothetical protein
MTENQQKELDAIRKPKIPIEELVEQA